MLSLTAALVFGAAIPEGISAHTSLTSWVTYWNMDEGQKEYKEIENRLSGVSYFAASFDENDHLYVPGGLKKLSPDPSGKKEVWLSVVNDARGRDGRSTQKDIEVLRRVLKNEKTTQAHVREIIDLAESRGIKGIEIDYEGIWKRGDDRLAADYLHFLYVLQKEADREHMNLRVVLEPSVPFDAGFPNHISYVVMFYNLYGTHSGPGPKADDAFIDRVCRKMAALPGEKNAAFSSGGCLWKDGGNGTFITEQEAASLIKEHGLTPVRDEKSQALTCSYDEDGHHIDIWYADVQTINHWMDRAKEQGISQFSLWSLGGNEDFQELSM